MLLIAKPRIYCDDANTSDPLAVDTSNDTGDLGHPFVIMGTGIGLDRRAGAR
jgi:hypothetical protein